MKQYLALLTPALVPSYFIIRALQEYCLSLWRIGAFRDWRIFYDAGQAMRYGLSPFEVVGYFNPIQLAWFIRWTVWIPFPLWVALAILCTSVAILIVARKNALWYFLSLPFIFSIWMGMVDMFLWLPARLFGGIGLSLLTLKPQLFALYAPFQIMAWVREKNFKQICLFIFSTFALWGIPALVYPPLITDWLHSLPTLQDRLFASSLAGYSIVFGSLLFYYSLFAVVMLLLLWTQVGE